MATAEADIAASTRKTDPDPDPDPDPNLGLELDPILKQGEVTYKDQVYTLTARATGLTLLTTSEGSSETPALQLPWTDVVCARAQETPGKSRDGQHEQGTCRSVTLHHVTKAAKSNKLLCETANLKVGQHENAAEWIDFIEEKRKQGKPRHVLVIINPIGGKGQGLKIFQKRVQPLFDLAGITFDLTMTNHYKHAEEIASTWDMTSVDGVVVGGGDGFYTEVLQGLMKQTQLKEGVDINDPDAVLSPLPVPIALLPLGTGNGVSGWINGDVLDVVTATLNVIRGVTTKINMLTVHDGGKLVHYCGLRLAYGFFAQMMKRTDEKRWMKRARYPYALLTSVFWKKEVFDLEMDILQVPSPQNNQPAPEETSASAAKWISLGRKSVSNLMGWAAEFVQSPEGHVVFDPFSAQADLILGTSTSGLHYLSFIFKMATRKKDLFDDPSIERYDRVVGFRFRYVGERSAEADSPSERDLLIRALDIDGEIQDSDVTAVDCRLLSQFVPVFGVRYVPS